MMDRNIEVDDFVDYNGYANKRTPRLYCVCGIKYDFEGDTFSYIDLKKTNEFIKYGIKLSAINYAYNLYLKYKKQLDDENIKVCIREKLIFDYKEVEDE